MLCYSAVPRDNSNRIFGYFRLEPESPSSQRARELQGPECFVYCIHHLRQIANFTEADQNKEAQTISKRVTATSMD